jgi:hypothetical protein
MLKVTEKGLENKVRSKETRRKIGRRSKSKGNNFEREVAQFFKNTYNIDLRRTPSSGGFATHSKDYKGDIVSIDAGVDFLLHIEAKNVKRITLDPWMTQAEKDCPEGRIPCVVYHKHNTPKNYIALPLEDFLKLVDREKIVREACITY